MTAQVIFLSTDYYPDEKELKRLDFYQEQFDLYHAQMAYEIKEQKLNQWQTLIYKERSHGKIRAMWKVLKTEQKDEEKVAGQ